MSYGYVTPYRRPMGWSTFERKSSDMLSDLNRQINRLFDDVFDFNDDDDDDGETKSKGRRMKAPAMDIATFDDRFELTAELPGVAAEDVELKIEEGLLIFKGEKKKTFSDDDKTWSERRFGTFQRRVQLPQDVDQDRIEADFSHGLLTVTMPRLEKANKGRIVSIKTRDEYRHSALIDDDSTKVTENA